jgi:hypothetical protein
MSPFEDEIITSKVREAMIFVVSFDTTCFCCNRLLAKLTDA